MAPYPLERALRELGIQPILAPTGTPAPGKGVSPRGLRLHSLTTYIVSL
jgi:hypothetical protein